MCPETYPRLILKMNTVVAWQPESSPGLAGSIARGDPNSRDDFAEWMMKFALAVYLDSQRGENRVSRNDGNFHSSTAAIQIEAEEDPELAATLSNESETLFNKFEHLRGPNDLNDAILHQEMAVDLVPNDHPDKPFYLSKLGALLQSRFLLLGDPSDIDNAVAYQQTAIDAITVDHPQRSKCLGVLGMSLATRFERFGNISDINNSIMYQREARDLMADDDPDKLQCLNNLGICLRFRFNRLQNLADIDSAISELQKAFDLTPENDFNKATPLVNLGASLQDRFERLGKLADIDNAITQLRLAISLMSDDNPSKHFGLVNLGCCLSMRFDRFGSFADIDEAIELQQAGINFIPDKHPEKHAYLANLGTCYGLRFKSLQDVADIDRAITNHQAAAVLTPNNHPRKASYLRNLGISFTKRFELLGSHSDINDAVRYHRAAVNLVPEGQDKSSFLTSFGNALQYRFRVLGSVSDINNAIAQHQASVALVSANHPERTARSMNLGNSLLYRYLCLHHPQDLEAAISFWSSAVMCPVGHPVIRFDAVKSWIRAASRFKHESVMAAYECAIDIMPIIAWLGLPIVDRHQHLVKIGGVVRDAAATAISLEQHDKALEWLEQGRSIVWSQILQLRTPIDELRGIDSGLADRLLEVSRLIHLGPGVGGSGGEPGSMREEGVRYRALTTEWESIIGKIRSLPNCEDFLRPPRSSQLLQAAQKGSIVVLNIVEERCDALVLVPGLEEVVHIPLPKITSKRVTELQEELKGLLSSSGLRMRGDRAAKKAEDTSEDDDFKHILAELWNGLVKPILDSLAFSVSIFTMGITAC
jgi:tetratricopeptide (TPR) repeat protein